MWKFKRTDEYIRKHARYEKKGYGDEIIASLNNVDTYFRALEAGANPLQISFGFVHDERQGVWAIADWRRPEVAPHAAIHSPRFGGRVPLSHNLR